MSTTAFRTSPQLIAADKLQLPVWKGQTGREMLRCDVVFGSPSLECRGTGVCKITAHDRSRDQEIRKGCNRTTAFLAASEGGQGVSMIMMRELLCVNILRLHLRQQVLVLNEPCPIPHGFVSSLGLKMDVLKPGSYPIYEMPGYFRIDFK